MVVDPKKELEDLGQILVRKVSEWMKRDVAMVVIHGKCPECGQTGQHSTDPVCPVLVRRSRQA